MQHNLRRIKAACYSANVSMAVIANLSPVLFITFHDLYGISFSLLGLLVLINFFTQLLVDLAFSFFSHKINIPLAVRLTPVLATIGIWLYAAAPLLFPNSVYGGLVLGTIIFSAGSGLAEVLISPVIAALPSENPDREMSKLHSAFAWGSVGTIIFATLFLLLFGRENWQIMGLVLSSIPLLSALLFWGCPLPEIATAEKCGGVGHFIKMPTLWLCVAAIFLGGASECTMSQWCSGYAEQALGIPKVWGDIFGTALFAFFLGIGRSLYSKMGKNLGRVLFWGGIGAFSCYIIATLCPIPILGLFATAFTGFCVSMMWPGSLVVAERKIPNAGVFIFAMMAAGGDLGASLGPQLVGLVTDSILNSSLGPALSDTLGIGLEQSSLKIGLLSDSIFPLLSILIFGIVYKSLKKENK